MLTEFMVVIISKYTKSSCDTPKANTMAYVNDISIKL